MTKPLVERVSRQLASASAYSSPARGACLLYVTPSLRVRPRYTSTRYAHSSSSGVGYVAAKSGDYARALASGVTCVPLLLETFGGCSPEVVSMLREAAEWRKNKLASSEYDETTWAARTWTSFVSQRISVAAQLAMAQEAAEALGMSVAADPRGQ